MESNESLQPHVHEPNPEPPDQNATFELHGPSGKAVFLAPSDLRKLPRIRVPGVSIVSTGHGTSGPFTFAGVALRDLVEHVLGSDVPWSEVEVISADGFGTRVDANELTRGQSTPPILLADEIDEQPMSRAAGLVRLIVPTELDDALRQVKWVRQIRVLPSVRL